VLLLEDGLDLMSEKVLLLSLLFADSPSIDADITSIADNILGISNNVLILQTIYHLIVTKVSRVRSISYVKKSFHHIYSRLCIFK